jgi:YfiH family protein
VLQIPALASQPGLIHGFSTADLGNMRRGGEDLLTSPRRAFATELGLDPLCIAFMGAVHGAHVAEADNPTLYDNVDAIVTRRPRLAIFATFADCYPILVYDPKRRVAGLAHAGWRGTAAKVTTALVEATRSESEDLIAGIGPGICGGCYQVSDEVARHFAAEVKRPDGEGRWLLDLAEANRLQLIEAGVDPANIHLHGACTKETAELPSHRRKPDLTRFACLLALA